MKVITGGRRRRVDKLKNDLLHPNQTAAVLLSPGQKILGLIILGLAAAMTVIYGFHLLLVTICALFIAFFVIYVALKVILWVASALYRYPKYMVPDVNDPTLPNFTILVTLKGEEQVVEHLMSAIGELQYPADKLECILILEDKTTDPGTWAAVTEELKKSRRQDLFKAVGVPSSLQLPQNKPRALVYGQTCIDPDSEFVVVYDAEDHPQSDQLLKAIGMFRAYEAQGKKVGCLQARLAFWNPRGSFVSVCYDAEYYVHFKWILPGLVWLGLIPPLGGTSNIFRRNVLDAVAQENPDWADALMGKHYAGSNIQAILRGAHDPHNITEDADLGARIRIKTGYSIAMLDSVTLEEAQVSWRGARKQRSRWLQGYLQTFFVWTRRPIRTINQLGWQQGVAQFLSFNLLMLGAPLSFLLSPIVWAIMFSYVAARLAQATAVSGYIERLFPGPSYLLGMAVFLVGNLILLMQVVITPGFQQEAAEKARTKRNLTIIRQREQILEANHDQEEYGLTVRLLFIPLFWMFTCLSAFRALRKLLTPSLRSHWDKTHHGHARDKLAELQAAALLEIASEDTA